MRPARRGALAISSALALAAVLSDLHSSAQSPPAQIFRTGTDVVLVDVSVRDRGQPVTGLAPDDFVLTDNGVRQHVDSVDVTDVPIDLTLVVDVSGNPRSPWAVDTNATRVAEDLRGELSPVAQMLRPGDRMRVLAVDTEVQELWPMQEVTLLPDIPPFEAGGLGALYDSLAAALLQPVEPARRHVVIARTKGVDNFSAVDAEALRAIAERSDALVHLVSMESALDYDAELSGFQCRFMGYCWPTRRYWIPFDRRLISLNPRQLTRDGRLLAAAAEATGGGFHQASLLRVPTLNSTFRRTFEDFRQGYMLRYRPAGVARTGSHTIEVEVSRSRSYTVRWRRGYYVEDPAVPPAPTIVAEPRTLAELTRAYELGAYRQVSAALRQVDNPARLLREFDQGGNPWPASPRLEAAFALELAEPGLFSPDASARYAARDVLERFSRLVRQPLGPDMFERYWYFAALTLLEGTVRPGTAARFAQSALARFPDEPRFVFSQAILADQRATIERGAGIGTVPSPEDAAGVRARYLAAIALPPVSAEARIRLAWLLHRLGNHAEALHHLDAVREEEAAEPALLYLRALFRGHVLGALGDHDGANAAFRQALAVFPGAQSARVALMNSLLMHGDRAAAEALAAKVEADRGEDLDPWWMYWQGQYRLSDQAMAMLRQLSR